MAARKRQTQQGRLILAAGCIVGVIGVLILADDAAACCGVSPDQMDDAKRLVEQLPSIPEDELRLRLVLGQICTGAGIDCGTLTEDQAKRVIEDHQADNARWWDGLEKIVLGLIALAGLGLGVANRLWPAKAG